MMAIVLEANGAVSSVGLVTDLEAADALRMNDRAPISDDDCIAAHRILQQESRAFCAQLMTSEPQELDSKEAPSV